MISWNYETENSLTNKIHVEFDLEIYYTEVLM